VEAPGAEYVELTGDFTDWQPIPLMLTERGHWELAIHIEPGVHRVNVRLNTATWIVPQGMRAEEDEFGGRVGILVVPER
jgi:1,4-alpha-glucan branching enzyme